MGGARVTRKDLNTEANVSKVQDLTDVGRGGELQNFSSTMHHQNCW